MKLSKEQIVLRLKEELQKRPEVLFVYLFGSFVEEEEFRDVDVALYVRKGSIPDDGMWYSIRLSLDLERAIGYSVDVILMNSAPDHLIHRISKGRVLVDVDEDFRTDFITAAWKRYFDIQPKRLQALRDILS